MGCYQAHVEGLPLTVARLKEYLPESENHLKLSALSESLSL